MRKKERLNEGWYFSKECEEIPKVLPAGWEKITLPHTWNAVDGQDGGSDYFRGACYYGIELEKPDGEAVYLEFEAAANAAAVYVNGQEAGYHEGGYSIFRVRIDDKLTGGRNCIIVCVDNSSKDNIYPQVADFTFYGGLYRGVSLICVRESHFDLDYFGGEGVEVSCELEENFTNAVLHLHAFIEKPEKAQTILFTILDAQGKEVAQVSCPAKKSVETKVMLLQVHLWNGIKDPYLYQVAAQLVEFNQVIDEVRCKIGVREFFVDSQKGFFLNGKSFPLRGVSRHQDWLGLGNALTEEQHKKDMELIKEIGANTIRLAHYQHSQEFYDMCDEEGMIVWAEIPFISVMNMEKSAHENCISQMKELIVQNYNHPCICFWGIANEITIGGERLGLVDNLKDLNELVHKMDKHRLSTIAQVSMLPMDSEMNQITDIVSYNHYMGWYKGDKEENEKWLDEFHEKYPEISLGLSEYGAEGIISYHSDEPKVRDYSEDYQALYHEHMAKIIKERPWLWSTHVWNMFDFGCDARDEGGVKGRNNKGLVTFDRKIKKDAFYVYKAFWSENAFVHICGKRYVLRAGDTTKIKVYSNKKEVTLLVNGSEYCTLEGEYIFVFENVPLKEEYTMISAVSGECRASMTIQKAEKQEESYILVQEEREEIANWFRLEDYENVGEIEIKEGYFSIKDKVEDILADEEAGNAFVQVLSGLTGMKIKKTMLNMMKDLTLEQMVGVMGEDQKQLKIMNEVLNKIKK